MNRQGCDLHDIPDIEQVEPLALIKVPEQYFHVQRLIVSHEKLTLGRYLITNTRINLILFLKTAGHFFMLYHAILNLLNDWKYSQGCAFEHRDGVIVVDEVGLGARVAHRHAPVFKFLPFLLLMYLLFLFLCNYRFFDVKLAKANQVIDKVL